MKMSKTIGNCIYLSDDEKTLKKKVMKMYSSNKALEEPGATEGNPVFTYLDTFAGDKEKVEELKAHYRKGGLGDGTVKKFLHEVLEELLAPIRKRREEYAKDAHEVMKILKKGTDKARETTSKTLSDVREVMKINYF